MLDLSTTFSIFDCINECIKNSFCYSATYVPKENLNCYLKTKNEDTNATSNYSSENQIFEIKGELELNSN